MMIWMINEFISWSELIGESIGRFEKKKVSPEMGSSISSQKIQITNAYGECSLLISNYLL